MALNYSFLFCYIDGKETNSIYLYKNKDDTIWKKVINFQSIEGSFYQIHWEATKEIITWSSNSVFLDPSLTQSSEFFSWPKENFITTYIIHRFSNKIVQEYYKDIWNKLDGERHIQFWYSDPQNNWEFTVTKELTIKKCSPGTEALKDLPNSYISYFWYWIYSIYFLFGIFILASIFFWIKKIRKKNKTS